MTMHLTLRLEMPCEAERGLKKTTVQNDSVPAKRNGVQPYTRVTSATLKNPEFPLLQFWQEEH